MCHVVKRLSSVLSAYGSVHVLKQSPLGAGLCCSVRAGTELGVLYPWGV